MREKYTFNHVQKKSPSFNLFTHIYETHGPTRAGLHGWATQNGWLNWRCCAIWIGFDTWILYRAPLKTGIVRRSTEEVIFNRREVIIDMRSFHRVQYSVVTSQCSKGIILRRCQPVIQYQVSSMHYMTLLHAKRQCLYSMCYSITVNPRVITL